MDSFLSNFPKGFTPRAQQTHLLQQIEAAYKEGYKYVICSAPTGSGKSFISKTIGNASKQCSSEFQELVMSYKAYQQSFDGYTYAKDCYGQGSSGCFALTITKSLQDQYANIFDDAQLLKGKTNYQCKIDENFDVETAPCMTLTSLKEECWRKNLCPYYNARNRALVEKFSVLNYKMFLALPSHLKKKEYIVCDEASELEDEIVKQFSVSVDPDKLIKLGFKSPILYSTKHEKVLEWVNLSIVALNDHVKELQSKHTVGNKPMSIGQKQVLNYFKNLQATLQLINETWMQCEYICQKDGKIVRLTPLRVNALSKYIFDYADKVLLMSATIIDPANYAKSLGIDKFKYIEVQSTFDPAKAPIYVSSKYKLNHANLEKNLPGLLTQIRQICDEHHDVKGIIHTHTMAITEYLQSQIKSERFLFRDKETNNEALMEDHSSTPEPTVLVSPSMTFGIDLKDDLARFQIIIKAGFLPLGDERIKRLFNEDKVWYTDKMLGNLVQACGRGARSETDHCKTYILDGVISEIVIRNRDKLPKYFIERFV